MRRAILEYPDPRLRLRAQPVIDFDPSLGALADDLVETLRAERALGLAAPQIDDRRAVLVIDPEGAGREPQTFVNPEILRDARPAWVEEGCASLPGIVGLVLRATRIRIRAQTLSGEPFERDLEDMAAVCLQHELDHLEGRLFVERLSLFRRLRVRAALAARRRRRAAA